MTATTHAFQAETRELLELVIHSLYSHREIFLRELVSNASDALDKLRVEALRQPGLLGADERLGIRIEIDEQARILRVRDNGIGMSREEVAQNIGTIARSGTKRFLEQLKAAKGEEQAAEGESGLPRLIGQFGVGFYSSFMVAREVVLETCRAGESSGTRWRSRGDGNYTLEDIPRSERGTLVELHLAPAQEGAHGLLEDFADAWRVRSIVKRYSDFVEYPIEMAPPGKSEGKAELEVVNSMKPLWTRPRAQIKPEEYAEFYRGFAHDAEDPLETLHIQAEGAHNWQALVFVPRAQPPQLFEPRALPNQLHLYVKRVHVIEGCEALAPGWMRFARGLVDSDDLPLNVSRETLQHERTLAVIRKHLARKMLEALAKMQAERRADYELFWAHAAHSILEGIYHENEQRAELVKLALVATSAGGARVTLSELVQRLPVKQKDLWAVSGADAAVLEHSPATEKLRAHGIEVLLLGDPLEELAFERLGEFEGRKIRFADREHEDPDEGEARAARERREQELSALPGAVRERLGPAVASVRFSTRLVQSPAALVGEPGHPSPRLLRALSAGRAKHEEAPRALELNAAHPLVARLEGLRESEPERFGELCELLYGQALLAEGSALPQPARFAQLLATQLMK
jgi:molecular chaperone HtpG